MRRRRKPPVVAEGDHVPVDIPPALLHPLPERYFPGQRTVPAHTGPVGGVGRGEPAADSPTVRLDVPHRNPADVPPEAHHVTGPPVQVRGR